MMRVLVSGATGLVGRFAVEHLLAEGHEVVAGLRQPVGDHHFSRRIETVPLTLDPEADQTSAFQGMDGFVHAAFSHVPGRYRGGEGDDPDGFRRANLDGSLTLFAAARRAGVSRCVFLSSRAVYGRQKPGAVLTEETVPEPESLYGIVKLETEQALAAMNREDFVTASIRATGVYGLLPGVAHKWEGAFRAYLAGNPVADRIGTEVHGADLAAAVRLLLTVDARLVGGRTFNASDVLTGTRDALSELQQVTGCPHPLPRPEERSGFNVMDTSHLRSLGWVPGGLERWRSDIAALSQRLSDP